MKVELSNNKKLVFDFPEEMFIGDELFLVDEKGNKMGIPDGKGGLKPLKVTKIILEN
jgi:hypothetical protein